ncbi:hypothetical protein HNY73_005954 [Argiope bruennichi]|uniref:Uncharacterized protein n=1 Tax=Argiope bruennichi TaxID=94029 RepID=A0A8T0FIC8_ARGBR|nr:hypothetical protein HNY73_005954 [Argiope bruennichi]
MAEGGREPWRAPCTCVCTCPGGPPPKKKPGIFTRMFRFLKKKKTSKDPSDCRKCIESSVNMARSPYTMGMYIEKERRLAAESKRKEPNFSQLPTIPDDSEEDNIYLEPETDERRFAVASTSTAGPSMTRQQRTDARAVRKQPKKSQPLPKGKNYKATKLDIPQMYHAADCACCKCQPKLYDENYIAMDTQVVLHNSVVQQTLTDAVGLCSL